MRKISSNLPVADELTVREQVGYWRSIFIVIVIVPRHESFETRFVSYCVVFARWLHHVTPL